MWEVEVQTYLIRFFSRLIIFSLEILRTFTGIFLRLRRSEYSFSVGGTILKTFLRFFKNRSFGGVEPPKGLEIVSDILTQNFLEIRILTATGAGLDQPCSAGLGRAKTDESFSGIVKAGERTCSGAAGEMS